MRARRERFISQSERLATYLDRACGRSRQCPCFWAQRFTAAVAASVLNQASTAEGETLAQDLKNDFFRKLLICLFHNSALLTSHCAERIIRCIRQGQSWVSVD
jgi:hypothetical protein